MSRRDPSSLLWDAYEASLVPPPGSAERNLARLQQRIRAGEDVELDEPEPAPRRRVAAAGLLWWGKAVGASVGLGATAVLSLKLTMMGWAALSRPEPAEAEPVAHESTTPAPAPAPAQPSRSPTETLTEDPSAEPPELEAVVAAREGEPAGSPASRRRAAPTTADALRVELALMDRARAALEDDDAVMLWSLTTEHARRFPTGALSEERRAWQAVAACALGRSDAQARAAEFLRRHAGSAQAPRVREACVPTRTIE